MLLALLVVLVNSVPIIKLRLIGADENCMREMRFCMLGSVLLITPDLRSWSLIMCLPDLARKMADGARVIADEVARNSPMKCG